MLGILKRRLHTAKQITRQSLAEFQIVSFGPSLRNVSCKSMLDSRVTHKLWASGALIRLNVRARMNSRNLKCLCLRHLKAHWNLLQVKIKAHVVHLFELRDLFHRRDKTWAWMSSQFFYRKIFYLPTRYALIRFLFLPARRDFIVRGALWPNNLTFIF